MEVYRLAFALFLISNPIGIVPIVVSLTRDFPFEKQMKIMLRECLFALLLALIFLFVGEGFLQIINIESHSLSIAGGILLFTIALGQIFPTNIPLRKEESKKEPFLVPIATPLLAGGGLMSTIMLYAAKENDPIKMTGAILLAWLAIMPIMMLAPYVQKILGKQGVSAMEQFMGLILALLSLQLIVQGAAAFIGSVQ